MVLKKILGVLLLAAAAVGIILSIIGIVEVWQVRPVVTQAVSDNLALLDET